MKQQTLQDMKYYEKYIGKKFKGFEFESTDKLSYVPVMVQYENKELTIVQYSINHNTFSVKETAYVYPADLVIKQIENEIDITKVFRLPCGNIVGIEENGDIYIYNPAESFILSKKDFVALRDYLNKVIEHQNKQS